MDASMEDTFPGRTEKLLSIGRKMLMKAVMLLLVKVLGIDHWMVGAV